MSKTLLTQVAAYVDGDEVGRLDALRGDIPRARVLSRALHRFIIDLESGKESLLPGAKVSPNQSQTAAVSSSLASHNTTSTSNPGDGSTRKEKV
jgi:hypothetical protein